MNHPKLPVLQLLFQSYEIFFKNIPTVLKLLWFPTLVSISSRIFSVSPEGAILAVILGALYLICTIPAITSWHRLVILEPDNPDRRIGLSFKSEEWNYFARLLVLILAAVVFFMIVGFLISGIGKALELETRLGPENAYALTLISTLVNALIFLPLSGFMLMLPAAAVGHLLRLGDTGKYAKGNISRIWLLYMLALIPQSLLNHVFFFFTSGTFDETSSYFIAVRILFESFIELFFFMITVGVLSLAYTRLVGDSRLSELEVTEPRSPLVFTITENSDHTFSVNGKTFKSESSAKDYVDLIARL